MTSRIWQGYSQEMPQFQSQHPYCGPFIVKHAPPLLACPLPTRNLCCISILPFLFFFFSPFQEWLYLDCTACDFRRDGIFHSVWVPGDLSKLPCGSLMNSLPRRVPGRCCSAWVRRRLPLNNKPFEDTNRVAKNSAQCCSILSQLAVSGWLGADCTGK